MDLKVEQETYERRPCCTLWEEGLSEVAVSLLVSCSAEDVIVLAGWCPCL